MAVEDALKNTLCWYMLEDEVEYIRIVFVDKFGTRCTADSHERVEQETELVHTRVFSREELGIIQQLSSPPPLRRILCINRVRASMPAQTSDILEKDWASFNKEPATAQIIEGKEHTLGAVVGAKPSPVSPATPHEKFFLKFDAKCWLYKNLNKAGYTEAKAGEWQKNIHARVNPFCHESTFHRQIKAGTAFPSDLHGINFFLRDNYQISSGIKVRTNEDVPLADKNRAKLVMALWYPIEDIFVSNWKESSQEIVRGKRQFPLYFFTAYRYPLDEYPEHDPTDIVPVVGRFVKIQGEWWIAIPCQMMSIIRDHGCVDIKRKKDGKFSRQRLYPSGTEEGFRVDGNEILFRAASVWDWNPEEVIAGQGNPAQIKKRAEMIYRAKIIAQRALK